jgi:hypothetical protein
MVHPVYTTRKKTVVVHTNTHSSPKYEYDMVNMGIMQEVFSMQMRPVTKTKEVIKEMVQIAQENCRSQDERKENMTADFASPHQYKDQPPSIDGIWFIYLLFI